MASSALAFLLFLATVATAGHAAPPDSLTAIDRFCNQLRPLTKKTRGRLFALLEDNTHNREGAWREYADLDVLQRLIDEQKVFDAAIVWMRDDGATAVSWTVNTPSGDWLQFVDMCYRVDGTLARSSATYNTFEVDDDKSKGASRKRTRYFDAAGHRFKTREYVEDLSTKQPAPQLRFMNIDEQIYKQVRDLPFASLLRHTAK